MDIPPFFIGLFLALVGTYFEKIFEWTEDRLARAHLIQRSDGWWLLMKIIAGGFMVITIAMGAIIMIMVIGGAIFGTADPLTTRDLLDSW